MSGPIVCIRSLSLGGVEVRTNGAGVGHVVVREYVGVGHAKDFEAEDAGHLLEVDEMGIGVLNEPGVVVEGGVIDAIGPSEPMSVEGTPACCRNGVKSEPEPRSPTCTSSRADGAFDFDVRRIVGECFSIVQRRFIPWGWGLAGDLADELLE